MLRSFGPLIIGLSSLVLVAGCGGDDTGGTGGGGGSSGGTGGSAATGGAGGGTGGAGGVGGMDASAGGGGAGGTAGSGGSGGRGGSAGGGGSTGTGGVREGGNDAPTSDVAVSPLFSFFVTSTGSGAQGGNLGGLAGADQKCQTLGAHGKTWKAYLSVSAGGDGSGAINARDRIGSGPWYNIKGDLIARNLTELHEEGDAGMNGLTAATGLDENGNPVPTANNPDAGTRNEHDILTGSMPDGRAFPSVPNFDCNGWTSNQAAPPPVPADAGDAAASVAAAEASVPGPRAEVGHINRTGTNAPPANASWNSSHSTPGCSQANIQQVGGAGRIYCFAVATPVE